MRLRADGEALRRRLRERAFERVAARLMSVPFTGASARAPSFGLPRLKFRRALEIGGGSGAESVLLCALAEHVVTSEYRVSSFAPGPATAASVFRATADAEALPFATGSFDLVWSSHVLEHLPNLGRALAELGRVLAPDGLHVHIVPSRFWKVLDFGLFYPSQAVHLLERVERAQRAVTKPASVGLAVDGRRSNPKLAPLGWARRSLWPPVHGVGRSNVAELRAFGREAWRARLEAAGLEIVTIVEDLPAHSPYRFGWESIRRLVERLGLSSSIGFIAVRKGRGA